MNDFTNLHQLILKMAGPALRQNAIMPRLALTDFSTEEGKDGAQIDLEVPRAKTVEDVNAGGAQNPDPRQFDLHPIKMDKWKQTSFNITDKEEKEVNAGILPADASESLKVLMNYVDEQCILAMRTKCPYVVGDKGIVPDSLNYVVDVRQQLQRNLAPGFPRGMVMDTTLEGNFLKLAAFSNPQASGRLDGLELGNMGMKHGFDMAADQNMDGSTITAGTHNGSEIVNGAGIIGITSIAIDGGTGTAKKGETFSFAGHSQKYILTADIADTSAGTLNFWPHLKVAVADNEAITFEYVASEVVNYHAVGFHKNFVGLVNRPMPAAPNGLGVISGVTVDPVTGLAVRLEVTRNNKLTTWTWDILFGVDVIRPELGTWLRS